MKTIASSPARMSQSETITLLQDVKSRPSPFGTMMLLKSRIPDTRTESQSAKWTVQKGEFVMSTSSIVTFRQAEKMIIWKGRGSGTTGPSPRPSRTSRKSSFCRVYCDPATSIFLAALRSMNTSPLPSICPRPVIETSSTFSE